VRLEEREHGSENCREFLCMIRASYHHEGDTRTPPKIAVALLECKTATGSGFGDTGVPESDDGSVDAFHIFDMDFFDEENLVIVYRSYAREGPDVIGMVDYGDIEYSDMALTRYVMGSWQEDIVAEMIKQMRAGQVSDLIYCSSREHAEWCLVVDICLDCEFSWPAPRHQSEKVAR